MKKYVQPARDLCMAIAVAFLVSGWWLLNRSSDPISPLAFLETALVMVIASEAYAKDE